MISMYLVPYFILSHKMGYLCCLHQWVSHLDLRTHHSRHRLNHLRTSTDSMAMLEKNPGLPKDI